MLDIPQILPAAITNKYRVDQNTFVQAVKENPKDFLEVEIGDIKQPDFYPQIKIKRWDNEINLSVRLIDDEPDAPAVKTEGNIIKWAKRNLEAHFYGKPQDEQNEDGAHEFEVLLKTKPKSNVLRFSIQTKGLECFYQPALTQEEIDRGAERPENVVGSYAVYYKDCPANYVGGKEYKTGKAFHIYRPQIIDAKGNKVWGELAIDEHAGILTVTIPQDFLDSALYPILVDPTFGYTTLGSGREVIGGASGKNSFRLGRTVALGVSGTLNFLSAGLKIRTAGSETTDVFVAINIENSAGSNSHGQVAYKETLNVLRNSTTPTWESFTMSSEALSPNNYILNVCANGAKLSSSDFAVAMDTGSSGNVRNTSGSTWASQKTNPWNAALSINLPLTDVFSIYATYTASGGTAPTVTTQAVSNIAQTTATGNGNVTADGGATITERGVCWKTSTGPTTADSKATASGTTGAFTASMTGLSANTTYYVKAYAINSVGTSYGSEVSFTTNKAVSVSDTGSGANSVSILVKLTRSDTGSGSDVASLLSRLGLSDTAASSEVVFPKGKFSILDSASGAETISALARVAQHDTGTATETLTALISLALHETGAGTDLASLFFRITQHDTGLGAEAISALIKITQHDTGAATEFISALIHLAVHETASSAEALHLLTRFALSDTGHGTDQSSVLVKVLRSDSGLAADLLTILRRVVASETGSGSDILRVKAKATVHETGSGTETVFSLASFLQKSVSDTGAGVDALLLLFHLSLTDTGAGQEAMSILTRRTLSDSGFGADIARVIAKLQQGDTGAGTEILNLVCKIAATDTGHATETLAILTALLVRETGSATEALSILARLRVSDLATAQEFITAIQRILSYIARNLYTPAKKFTHTSRSTPKDLYTPKP